MEEGTRVEFLDCVKEATINKSPFEAVCVASIIANLWNYETKDIKDGLEDLYSAERYIKRLIKELEDKSMRYKLVATKSGVGFETPWRTLIVPNKGDMFNPNNEPREHLLASLFKRGGYCPCQPQSEDSICPCKRYQTEGKCVCGLFVKVPTAVETKGGEDVSVKIVRTDKDAEDGEKE